MKDELRSMMGDERLNRLMLMAVKKNTVKDLDLLVDTFALKPRKLILESRLELNFMLCLCGTLFDSLTG